MIKILKLAGSAQAPSPIFLDDRDQIPKAVVQTLLHWLLTRPENEASLAVQMISPEEVFKGVVSFRRGEFRITTKDEKIYIYSAARSLHKDFHLLGYLIRIEDTSSGKTTYKQSGPMKSLMVGCPVYYHSLPTQLQRQHGLPEIRVPKIRASFRDLFPEDYKLENQFPSSEPESDIDSEFEDSSAPVSGEQQLASFMSRFGLTDEEAHNLQEELSDKTELLREDHFKGYRVITGRLSNNMIETKKKLPKVKRGDSKPYNTMVFRPDGDHIVDLSESYETADEAIQGHYKYYRYVREVLCEKELES